MDQSHPTSEGSLRRACILEEALMATESPNHPQPDEIPENERTGSEPNPTGKSGESKENTHQGPGAKILPIQRN